MFIFSLSRYSTHPASYLALKKALQSSHILLKREIFEHPSLHFTFHYSLPCIFFQTYLLEVEDSMSRPSLHLRKHVPYKPLILEPNFSAFDSPNLLGRISTAKFVGPVGPIPEELLIFGTSACRSQAS